MANDNPSHSNKSSLRWPLIIIGLLGAHVVAMLSAVAITARSPGESAVIPDYYDKAQAWDSYKQQLAINNQLGWKLDVVPMEQPDSTDRRQVMVTLTDAKDHPLSNADVAVHCFHLSHGDLATTVNPIDSGGGKYLLKLPLNHEGFWEFDVTASAGGQVFIQTLTRYVP